MQMKPPVKKKNYKETETKYTLSLYDSISRYQISWDEYSTCNTQD